MKAFGAGRQLQLLPVGLRAFDLERRERVPAVIVGCDPVPDLVHAVAGSAEPVEAVVAPGARRAQGGTIQRSAGIVPEPERVSHLSEDTEEFLLRHGRPHSAVDIRPDQAPVGGDAVSLRLVLVVIQAPGRGILDSGEPVPQTERVRRLPHGVIVPEFESVLMPVQKRNRIDRVVVVVMIPVGVRRDDHLVFIAPHLLGQLHTDLVGGLRADLTGGERLEPVVAGTAAGQIPAHEARPQAFGLHELLRRVFRRAVHPGDIDARAVLLFRAVRLRPRCLFRVFDVSEYLLHGRFDRPQADDRHLRCRRRRDTSSRLPGQPSAPPLSACAPGLPLSCRTSPVSLPGGGAVRLPSGRRGAAPR